MLEQDTFFMKEALKLANIAFKEDEVPVGAIITQGDKIIGKGYNQVELLKDPTAHAEILAITAACNLLGNKYLVKCTIYVTLEPCMMCIGAIREAQIQRVVFAAKDTTHKKLQANLFEMEGGILETESATLIKDFFKRKRI